MESKEKLTRVEYVWVSEGNMVNVKQPRTMIEAYVLTSLIFPVPMRGQNWHFSPHVPLPSLCKIWAAKTKEINRHACTSISTPYSIIELYILQSTTYVCIGR